MCGEGGIPTASKTCRDPYSASSSPEEEETRRLHSLRQTQRQPSPLSSPHRLHVAAAPPALRMLRAAAATRRGPAAAGGRMEEEEEEDGGRGDAGGSTAASGRFVRCLYAVGFLVSGQAGCGGGDSALAERPEAGGRA